MGAVVKKVEQKEGINKKEKKGEKEKTN